MLFRALQTSVRTRIRRSVPVTPPLFPARVYVPAIWSRLYPVPVRRSGYVEPPLPGAGLSFRFCAGVLSRPIAGLRERRAGLHREPVVVCVRCCRTFRAVCSGADMENRFEKAGRARSSGWNVEEKGRVRDESAEQRRGKTCGVRCCRSDAISRITIGCFETLTRHPAATAFGVTPRPVSLRDIRSGGKASPRNRANSRDCFLCRLLPCHSAARACFPHFSGGPGQSRRQGADLHPDRLQPPRPHPLHVRKRYSAAAVRPRLATRGNKGPLRSVLRNGRRCRMKTCR